MRAWVALLLLLAGSARADRLFWHDVRLDKDGKLLSWVDGDAPYARVVQTCWEMFKTIPVQTNGFRTYFTYPEFNGINDPSAPFFDGRSWAHNPAGLFTMLTDGATLYYAYSGDHVVMDRVREMLDHMLEAGLTSSTDYWANCPYSSSDAGDPEYRGGTDTIYCNQEHFTPCGRGDGVGYLEPDKIGELGYAYLQFYEFTQEKKYLEAAIHCADALALHIQPGDESHSPWPFRVDAATGKIVREPYTANTIGPIRLFDELIRIKRGNVKSYRRARAMAWQWLMTYPMRDDVWTQYFEDVLIYPDYRVNKNQYSALETARYLLQHPEFDPQAKTHAKHLIDWVTSHFAINSRTMSGLHERGLQWGAEALSEQINDMDKMSSHTARYASVRALYYEVTGDTNSKERAFRSFNWATYSAREDGLVQTSLEDSTGFWFSDGYGDYMRHFLRGMASVPEWAPRHESHLLRSTSIVRAIHYGDDKIEYETFDAAARDVLRLRVKPAEIRLGNKKLPRVDNLEECSQGYTLEEMPDSGCVVRLKRTHAKSVAILIGTKPVP
jgi:hypothetical protein